MKYIGIKITAWSHKILCSNIKGIDATYEEKSEG